MSTVVETVIASRLLLPVSQRSSSLRDIIHDSSVSALLSLPAQLHISSITTSLPRAHL